MYSFHGHHLTIGSAKHSITRSGKLLRVYLFHMLLVMLAGPFQYASHSISRSWPLVIYITIASSLCSGQESCASEGVQNTSGRIAVRRYLEPPVNLPITVLRAYTNYRGVNQHH